MKVSGAYESVVRGVSQQTPQDRRSGQHSEQVNMISDPVRGLVRRQGSRMLSEAAVPTVTAMENLLQDTKGHRVSTFYIAGTEYDLIYRTTEDTFGGGMDSFMWCFDRTANKFIEIVRNPVDTVLDTLVSKGVSASTGIGRYMYIAGNGIAPTYTGVDRHTEADNIPRTVAWVRGGAYSRTFKVKLTLSDGSKVTGQYKTVPASYPELLDTSDILSSDPDYQKKINDRVYAYNGQVTAWIGIAAEDITPENIASLVAADLTNKGITDVTVKDGTVCIGDTRIVSAEGEDGGDGSLIRVVDNEITNAELVSTIHWAGKVVKVKPSRAREDDSFYLEAIPKEAGATGWTEVSWRECAGYLMQPTTVFVLATVFDGKLYIAGTPAKLQALVGLVVPGFKANEVGDRLSSPLPTFFGKTITYLGQLQDRLVVGCGATLFMSRPGDYLNFFRASVLTVLDSDPIELYALGAEDDVIKYGVIFNRDLILYGHRFQYAINGRQPLTPKNASIVVSSAYKDTSDATPKASGNYVFYAKYSPNEYGYKSSLHQVGAGRLEYQPDSLDVSQQLDSYIIGRPAEIVTLNAPNLVVLRTDEFRHGFYTYTYLDAGGSERLFDAWSRWTWHPSVGSLIGVTTYMAGLLAYVVRERNGTIYVAAERFVLDTELSTLPYADSLQPLASAEIAPSMVGASAIVALARDGGPNELMGQPFPDLDTFKELYPTELNRAWVGYDFEAYVTPTNPYFRDKGGKAVMTGRMTLSKLKVAVANTAAMQCEVASSSGVRVALDYTGRIVGNDYKLGTQPIVTTNLPIFIGKEVKSVEYTLRAKSWLPLNITNIEWTGLVFTNTRRVT